MASGKQLRDFAAPSYIDAVAFSADGRRAVAAGGHGGPWSRPVAWPRDGRGYGFLIVYDVATGKELRRYVSDIVLKSMAVSPDGAYALSGGFDGTIQVWRLDPR